MTGNFGVSIGELIEEHVGLAVQDPVTLLNDGLADGLKVEAMANPEQVAKLKQGAQAWNVWRSEHPYAEIALRGAVLDHLFLPSANLRGANLREAELRGSVLDNSDLGGADLSAANLTRSWLGEANLSAANLTEAHLGYASLNRAQTPKTCLDHSSLNN